MGSGILGTCSLLAVVHVKVQSLAIGRWMCCNQDHTMFPVHPQLSHKQLPESRIELLCTIPKPVGDQAIFESFPLMQISGTNHNIGRWSK